jgi:hypothetical protein
MIKKNDSIRELDDEEIEEIEYYKRLFKTISNEIENKDLLFIISCVNGLF